MAADADAGGGDSIRHPAQARLFVRLIAAAWARVGDRAAPAALFARGPCPAVQKRLEVVIGNVCQAAKTRL